MSLKGGNTVGLLCPPFISIDPGLSNVRDIGGLPIIQENRALRAYVRASIIYRGPDISLVSESGLATLRSLGIITSFDLRSKTQIDRAGGHKDLAGIRRVWCPVFGEDTSTPEKNAIRYLQYSSADVKDTVDAFVEILIHGASVFRSILLHIASLPLPSATLPELVPALLVHCTTGNNRTGVFIGVLLSLLDVPVESIAAEYALSEIGLAPSRASVVARLVKNPIFAGEGGRARCERMIGARSESMVGMLEVLNGKWGSAEGYVKGCCGLSTQVIRDVRAVLTLQIEQTEKK